MARASSQKGKHVKPDYRGAPRHPRVVLEDEDFDASRVCRIIEARRLRRITLMKRHNHGGKASK